MGNYRLPILVSPAVDYFLSFDPILVASVVYLLRLRNKDVWAGSWEEKPGCRDAETNSETAEELSRLQGLQVSLARVGDP